MLRKQSQEQLTKSRWSGQFSPDSNDWLFKIVPIFIVVIFVITFVGFLVYASVIVWLGFSLYDTGIDKAAESAGSVVGKFINGMTKE